MRVALINMPFSAADRPSLALGLLQASLQQEGIQTVTKSYNLLFSKLLGHESYRRFADHFPTAVLAGEWVFSQAFFGQSFSNWDKYKAQVLGHSLWGVSDADFELIKDSLRLSASFLCLCEESSDWSEYDLVGFTSTFEQTMACMCLARAIKRKNPSVKIVMGGANFESTMALGYLDLFPFVDYICHGEGDVALPELCRELKAGNVNPPPGIVSQARREFRPCDLTTDLDSLPYPDFRDYFAISQRVGIAASCIPVEASRGCWWGEKSHCTFCGLNGRTMKFRQKSFRRIASEVDFLQTRHRPGLFQFTDNILSREYLRDLIPFWGNDGRVGRTPKFFETKSNLSRDELKSLVKAGVVSIQPGIESFSDTTLKTMGKGVSAAHNLAMIRWCAEVGMDVHYNLIFGFPKEDLDDYSSMLALVERIPHLKPPDACSPIRMDRFSPNFEKWREHGFESIRTMPGYQHIFPVPEESLFKIAYFFEYTHAHSDRLLELGQPLMQYVTAWNDRFKSRQAGELVIRRHINGGTIKIDTRSNVATDHRVMDKIDLAVLLACDKPISRGRLNANLSLEFGEGALTGALERLEKEDCVIDCGGRLVSSALLRDDVRELVPITQTVTTERSEGILCQITQN